MRITDIDVDRELPEVRDQIDTFVRSEGYSNSSDQDEMWTLTGLLYKVRIHIEEKSEDGKTSVRVACSPSSLIRWLHYICVICIILSAAATGVFRFFWPLIASVLGFIPVMALVSYSRVRGEEVRKRLFQRIGLDAERSSSLIRRTSIIALLLGGVVLGILGIVGTWTHWYESSPECDRIIEAVRSGDTRTVRNLLRSDSWLVKCQPAPYVTPLQEAVRGGHADIVKVLLDAGADPDKGKPDPPLRYALVFPKPQIVQILLGCGAKLDVFCAAGLGRLKYVSGVIKEDNQAVNQRDGRGYTPLHYAVANGRDKVTQFLLDKGAQVSIKGGVADMSTPLHLAALYGHTGIARLLLEGGATKSIEIENGSGLTPLEIATARGNSQIQRLIEESKHQE